jgi:hypothetical protein
MELEEPQTWGVWHTPTHDQRLSPLAKNLPHQELVEIILNFLNILLVKYTGSPKWLVLHKTKGAKLARIILMNRCI